MKKTVSGNKGIKRIIAAALAAAAAMAAAAIAASAAGAESIPAAGEKAVVCSAEQSREPIAEGKVFGIGEKIKLDNEYAVIDDFAGGSKTACITGEFTPDTEFIGYTMKGQFEFIGLFGDKDLCVTALDPVSTRPCDVKGIRVASGTGTESDPYRFETAF